MTPRPPTRPDAGRRPPPWTWCRGEPRRAPSAPRPPAWPRTAQTSFRTRLVGEKTARRRSFLDAASAMPPARRLRRDFHPNTPRARLRRGGEICKDRCVETRRTVVSGFAMLDAIGAIRFQFLSTGAVARSIGTSDENRVRDPSRRRAILRRVVGSCSFHSLGSSARKHVTSPLAFSIDNLLPRFPFARLRGTVPPCRITWAAC